MGVYLNSKTAYTLYQDQTEKPYFVDKTMLLKELFPLVKQGSSYICITRPRRFGKTVMANMIAAFFSSSCDARPLFGERRIASDPEYEEQISRYPVIHISFNDTSGRDMTYKQYISRIENRLIRDLEREYPETKLQGDETAVDAFTDLYAEHDSARFIFVLDEWDYIFHQDFASETDKRSFLAFLRSLLKDRPYVRLAYMTGILPIAKYSSGSELNMFAEYTMVTEEKFSEYFGFTDAEVSELYERYLRLTETPCITREGIRKWYNGYHTRSGERVYNPRSVVSALGNNNLGNYWTSSGPYDEIFYYIENNVDAVRDELALMISGAAVPTMVREYAATSSNLKTKEEILSAMVVYGFLSYENGKVSIPNRELMDRFADVIKKEHSLGYVYRLAKESDRMLSATKAGDTDTMSAILELAHDSEIPLLSYNNETDLTAVVNLVYLSARNTYRVEREDKAGLGYVNFIFYPELDRSDDCMILELKVDHSAEEAIEQIKQKKYALRFAGKLGEPEHYSGRILAVGIGYDKKKKCHECKVEVMNG